MKYSKIVIGKFCSRPNRFIAQVLIGDEKHTVHVKNTGRCKELLVEGATVVLWDSENKKRKTRYDLIAVIKKTEAGEILINMDSQIPNSVVAEWLALGNLFSKKARIRREVSFGDSRFDLYVEDGDRKAFIEVKGVTLERDGIALFPDAPTLRGVKHLKELARAVLEGYEAYAFFVIQMKGPRFFCPNEEMHKDFADALREVHDAGVSLLAYDCKVEEDAIVLDEKIPIKLSL